jgi:hypothetical protein
LLKDGRGAKEEDNSQVTEPLKEEILNGDVHTIEEMKTWLKPFGYSGYNPKQLFIHDV